MTQLHWISFQEHPNLNLSLPANAGNLLKYPFNHAADSTDYNDIEQCLQGKFCRNSLNRYFDRDICRSQMESKSLGNSVLEMNKSTSVNTEADLDTPFVEQGDQSTKIDIQFMNSKVLNENKQKINTNYLWSTPFHSTLKNGPALVRLNTSQGLSSLPNSKSKVLPRLEIEEITNLQIMNQYGTKRDEDCIQDVMHLDVISKDSIIILDYEKNIYQCTRKIGTDNWESTLLLQEKKCKAISVLGRRSDKTNRIHFLLGVLCVGGEFHIYHNSSKIKSLHNVNYAISDHVSQYGSTQNLTNVSAEEWTVLITKADSTVDLYTIDVKTYQIEKRSTLLNAPFNKIDAITYCSEERQWIATCQSGEFEAQLFQTSESPDNLDNIFVDNGLKLKEIAAQERHPYSYLVSFKIIGSYRLCSYVLASIPMKRANLLSVLNANQIAISNNESTHDGTVFIFGKTNYEYNKNLHGEKHHYNNETLAYMNKESIEHKSFMNDQEEYMDQPYEYSIISHCKIPEANSSIVGISFEISSRQLIVLSGQRYNDPNNAPTIFFASTRKNYINLKSYFFDINDPNEETEFDTLENRCVNQLHKVNIVENNLDPLKSHLNSLLNAMKTSFEEQSIPISSNSNYTTGIPEEHSQQSSYIPHDSTQYSEKVSKSTISHEPLQQQQIMDQMNRLESKVDMISKKLDTLLDLLVGSKSSI